MKNRILLVILLVSIIGCKNSKTVDEVATTSKSQLIEVFKASTGDYPNIVVEKV
jgi:hypothetical protein